MSVKYYLILVLMYLMINDVQHLFMYLLAIYVPRLKCLFMYFAHFSIGSLSYTYWFLKILYIWLIILSFVSSVYCIFSQLVMCLSPFKVSVDEQNSWF